jgi:gas vesicle protein
LQFYIIPFIEASAMSRYGTRTDQDLLARTDQMSENKATITFLTGFGIGVALGLLFAPQSGEQTREWLADTAESTARRIRRKGRRAIFETLDAIDRGEQAVSRALRTGKRVVNALAEKLDQG